jgi:hypothetical protein
MKFDSLVFNILTEATKERKTYHVTFSRLSHDKYSLKDATTTAFSGDQAIGLVISSQLREKVSRDRLGLIIWEVKNKLGADAKIKVFKPKPVEIKEKPPEDKQMDLSFESFDKEKKEGLHGWFSRNHGKGWVDCKRSKPGHIVPCGRKKGTKKGKGYPACRPTLSMCSGSKNKKKGHKTIKWKKKS